MDLGAWCTQNGAVLDGITAGFVEEGWRGIIATKDLAAGDVVLRVPERLLLTTRSAARDPALAAALLRASAPRDPQHPSTSPRLSPLQVLACHLLLELSRGAGSFWAPYLQQLPRSYSSLPNFAAVDAAELQLRHARDAAQAAAERAEEEWRGALPVLQQLGLPKRFTALRAWLWASCTLQSRTMYLPWCPAGALTPYGDLHNYQPPPPPYTPHLGAGAGSGDGGAGSTGGGGSVGATTAVNERATCGGAAAVGACGAAASAHTRGPQGGAVAVVTPGAVEPSGGESPEALPAVHALALGGAPAGGAGAEASGEALGPLVAAGARGVWEPGERRPALASTAGGGGGGGCSGIAAEAGSAGTPSLSDATAATYGSRTDGCGGAGSTTTRGPIGSEVVDGSGGKGGAGEEGCGLAAARAADGCGRTVEGGAAAAAPDEAAAEAVGIAGDGTWDEAAQQYCIIVRRPYRAGEQVMLCYGRHTNLELLEHYGFVLEANPHDTATLDPTLLPLPESALRAPAAPPLLAADCYLHANGQPSWQLLRVLRYCAATPAERRSSGHLLAAGEAVSEEGDRRVLSWLYTACSRQLADMGTSLQHDQQLLQQQQQQQQQQEPASEQRAQREAGGADAGPQAEAAPARAAALSDGLTCSALALRWRMLHKRVLLRAMSCAEAVLGPQQLHHQRGGSGRAHGLSLAELQRRLRPG